jgi:hypothetical protein
MANKAPVNSTTIPQKTMGGAPPMALPILASGLKIFSSSQDRSIR